LAEEWLARLVPYGDPLAQMCMDMTACENKAESMLKLYRSARAKLAGEPQNAEKLERFALNYLDKTIEAWGNVLYAFDNSMTEGENTISLVTAALKRFDSLPNKNRLCDLDSDLQETVNTIRDSLFNRGVSKASALVSFINWSAERMNQYDSPLIGEECHALIREMNSRQPSSEIQGRVDKLIAEIDKISEKLVALIARGNENIEAYNGLLAHPNLTSDNKVNLNQAQEQARFLKSQNLLIRTFTEGEKIRLLASFSKHANRKWQEDEALEQWHQSLFCLLDLELAAVNVLMVKLNNDEKEEQSDPGKLPQDELEIRRQASAEGGHKYGRIIKAIKRHAAEYANLTGIARDERLLSAMTALAETAAEFVRGREYADSMWSGRIRNKEARKTEWMSFLPQRAPGQQDFHRTVGGVVVGQINPNGDLEEQDKSGKVISTYFKDEDSGNWVKDYGNEAEPVPSLQSAGTSAAGESGARNAKADALLKKAHNIVEASRRSVEKNLAADASDYDDKLHFLHRAFSVKAKAIAGVKNLMVELEQMQAKAPGGEDLAASLKMQVEQLQQEKNDLYVLLRQTQQDGHIHSLKSRDPTEAGFHALWKQGQVASVVKEFERRPNRSHGGDWLDRHVIGFTSGPQGEQYEPWIVHAHYDSNASSSAPVRVHMKRNAEKDWGVEQPAYHSLPLSEDIFKLIKQEEQKQQTPSARKSKGKGKGKSKAK